VQKFFWAIALPPFLIPYEGGARWILFHCNRHTASGQGSRFFSPPKSFLLLLCKHVLLPPFFPTKNLPRRARHPSFFRPFFTVALADLPFDSILPFFVASYPPTRFPYPLPLLSAAMWAASLYPFFSFEPLRFLHFDRPESHECVLPLFSFSFRVIAFGLF